MQVARGVSALHATYLVATGVWPIVHRRSFERVTGPKTDFWLVRTVGGLAMLCGVTLLYRAVRGGATADAKILAGGQAAVFVAADVYASARVSRVYLWDIVVQSALLPSWFRWRESRSGQPSTSTATSSR
jgi:hypothetical protein